MSDHTHALPVTNPSSTNLSKHMKIHSKEAPLHYLAGDSLKQRCSNSGEGYIIQDDYVTNQENTGNIKVCTDSDIPKPQCGNANLCQMLLLENCECLSRSSNRTIVQDLSKLESTWNGTKTHGLHFAGAPFVFKIKTEEDI